MVWALVAASVVFWGLRLFVKGPATPANALPVAESAVARGDLTRLFGPPPAAAEVVAAAAPALASRFRLFGVMAPKTAPGASAPSGLALIAVDGKPARPYPVGASIEGDLVVQSVSLRTAAIGSRGGASVLLELPPPAPASTGVPAAFGAAAPPPPAPPIPVPPPPTFTPVTPFVAPGAGAASIPGGPRRERGVATQ